jgi:aminopeptidase N
MLGDDLFKKALHGYMDRWHGKHPIPWDYFNSMSNISGSNLNWFFNNWFFSNYYIDLNAAKGN